MALIATPSDDLPVMTGTRLQVCPGPGLEDPTSRMAATIAETLREAGHEAGELADAVAAAAVAVLDDVLDTVTVEVVRAAAELLSIEAGRYVEGAFAAGIREASAVLQRLPHTATPLQVSAEPTANC